MSELMSLVRIRDWSADTKEAQFFEVEGKRVFLRGLVKMKGGNDPSCVCASFKVRGECEHVEAMQLLHDRACWEYYGNAKLRSPLVIRRLDVALVHSLTEKFTLCQVHAADSTEDVLALWGTFNPSSSTTAFPEPELGMSYVAVGLILEHCAISGAELRSRSLFDNVEIETCINEDTSDCTVGSDILDALEGTGGSEKVEKDTTKSTCLPWKNTAKPEGFFVSDENWEKVLWAASKGRNVLLTGSTGTGKTELVYHVAEALDLPLEAFNFGALSEPRTALIGMTHLDKETGTWFKKSRFVDAILKERGIILCDELTRANRDAFNIVLPLMDRQAYLALDESADASVVYRGEAVAFFATANIGVEYTGTSQLDRALRDRFPVKIELDYPDGQAEGNILKYRYPRIKSVWVKTIVKIAGEQRRLAAQGEFTCQISTRMLLDCAEMLTDSVSERAALEAAIFGCFDKNGDEASEYVQILQLFQKHNMITSDFVKKSTAR